MKFLWIFLVFCVSVFGMESPKRSLGVPYDVDTIPPAVNIYLGIPVFETLIGGPALGAVAFDIAIILHGIYIDILHQE